ncbi:zinc ribbon domain-containing protein, partial [Escherichia coli]|uniref:zinc-ribbon domain-containing protein n=1 Tax=Escherichia coli TaxID=562 RepID=UPI003079BE14
FGASTFLIGLILVAGVGGAGWYFWQQRNQVQANGQLAQTAFCANCGMPLTAQAKFCPHCGHQQS